MLLASAASLTLPESNTQPSDNMAHPGFFTQTSWTTVLEAKGGDETVRLAALERLLTRYRRPIQLELLFRARCNEAEAEDLMHQFIHNSLQRNFLKNIDPAKGRFRAFIKSCLINFLRDRHRQKTREPENISIDETDEEGQRLLEPAAPTSPPGTAADCEWARHVVALAMKQLEQECIAARRSALFTALKPFLDGDPDVGSYGPVALRLNMAEGALRTATHRMRQRLAELIEEEIKQTVGTQEDWREELRYFLDLLGESRANPNSSG